MVGKKPMDTKAKKKKTATTSQASKPEEAHIPHHTMMPYKFEPYQ